MNRPDIIPALQQISAERLGGGRPAHYAAVDPGWFQPVRVSQARLATPADTQ